MDESRAVYRLNLGLTPQEIQSFLYKERPHSSRTSIKNGSDFLTRLDQIFPNAPLRIYRQSIDIIFEYLPNSRNSRVSLFLDYDPENLNAGGSLEILFKNRGEYTDGDVQDITPEKAVQERDTLTRILRVFSEYPELRNAIRNKIQVIDTTFPNNIQEAGKRRLRRKTLKTRKTRRRS